MRVFVAGSTGVIGRRLVPMLVAAGHEVTGMTRSESRAGAVEAMGARAAVADVFDPDVVGEAIAAARPEVVVHQLTDLPTAIDFRRAETQFAGNDRIRTEGTRNLVAAARAAGARAFVAQSIAFAYEPSGDRVKDEDAPLNLGADWPWRRSMEAVRDLEAMTLGAEGMRGVVLRYGYFYGPGSSYDPQGGALAGMVRKRRFPIVGDGGGVFSFVHVDDAARATVIAVEGDATGVFNIVDDEPAAVVEWLPVYADALGARPPRRVPRFIARMAAGAQAVEFSTRSRGASNAKAKRELGWSPERASWRAGLGARS